MCTGSQIMADRPTNVRRDRVGRVIGHLNGHE
jgi:hypothetical protein